MFSKPAKIQRFVIFSALLFIAILTLSYLILIAWVEADRKENRNNFLNTSIPNNVAKDLCSRNLVPNEVAQCDGDIQIARREIVEIFRSQVSTQNTYDQVSNLFGTYEDFCSQETDESYKCTYYFGTAPRVIVRYDSKYNKITSIKSELDQK